MNDFQYIFECNKIESLITLDFANRKLLLHEDPYGRSSSSKPDYEFSFISIKDNATLIDKIKPFIAEETFAEILFLSEHYAKDLNSPEGKRLFYFKTSCNYSKIKEKPNFKIGFAFLVISITVFLYYIAPLIFSSSTGIKEIINSSNLRLLFFISLMCFSFFVALTLIYFKRIGTIGFNVLGTEDGIYVYDKNNTLNYKWNAFTGKHEVLKGEKSFFFELKELKYVYNKYGSNTTNKDLKFVGVTNFDFYLKIMISRIPNLNSTKQK